VQDTSFPADSQDFSQAVIDRMAYNNKACQPTSISNASRLRALPAVPYCASWTL